MSTIPDDPDGGATPERAGETSANPAGTNGPRRSSRHRIGAIVTALIGIAFFNLMVGVFGLPAAIVSLALFVALAVMIFRCPQAEETKT